MSPRKAGTESNSKILIGLVAEGLLSDPATKVAPERADEAAKAIVRHLCQVETSELTVPRPRSDSGTGPIALITMDSMDSMSAVSIKVSNLRLDFQKLMEVVLEGTLGIASAIALPWTIPLAAVLLLSRLFSQMKVEIGKDEGLLLYTMWKHGRRQLSAAKGRITELVNFERKHFGFSPAKEAEIQRSLVQLAKLGCIAESKSGSPRWILKESVRVKSKRAA